MKDILINLTNGLLETIRGAREEGFRFIIGIGIIFIILLVLGAAVGSNNELLQLAIWALAILAFIALLFAFVAATGIFAGKKSSLYVDKIPRVSPNGDRIPKQQNVSVLDSIDRVDAFFIYDESDKNTVTSIASRIHKDYGLKVWLTDWNQIPGEPFQEAVEKALGTTVATLVFIGSMGIQEWQDEMMRTAIQKRVEKDSIQRIMPIFLPGVGRNTFKLPDLLRRHAPIILDELDSQEWLHYITSGIKGEPPGPPN